MVSKEPLSKHIYIFENKMYPIIKIGMSDNPKSRIKTVQTNSGFPLEIAYQSEPILNPAIIEKLIHLELKEFRTKGEWFELDIQTAIIKIEEILKQSIAGKYKDLTLKYINNEEPCITAFEPTFTINGDYIELIEIEDFIYESKSYNYYICYKQGELYRTVKFCSRAIARKFRNEYLDKLTKLK
jgi:hypothetical protein